ncbi:hypothetical protein DM02DRAFT_262360 [Periconia macrospinosa]|uniref:Uncharacterized protein n=1 Tax=Periconia macrospinosa TaxID=97972 RepID=A0A2V1D491_9PLEO|nr:hypothetical protein DM02DRAFT_262360 [Periconia macrospinosa]
MKHTAALLILFAFVASPSLISQDHPTPISPTLAPQPHVFNHLAPRATGKPSRTVSKHRRPRIPPYNLSTQRRVLTSSIPAYTPRPAASLIYPPFNSPPRQREKLPTETFKPVLSS